MKEKNGSDKSEQGISVVELRRGGQDAERAEKQLSQQELLDRNIKPNSFARYGVHKPYTVFVAIAVIIMLGFFAFSNLTTELFPNMNIPYVVVTTEFDYEARVQD